MIDLYTGIVHSSVNVFTTEFFFFFWSLCAAHMMDYEDDFYKGKKTPSLKLY